MSADRGSTRLQTLLLALCAFFACGFVVLGGYAWRTRRLTRSLAAELAQREALRQELARGLPSDQALFPHAKNEVAYTFNPFIGTATLWGAAGHPYPVNLMGLRGPAIAAKAPGRTRIVLLGDSYFFGWKLREEEKLEHHLRALLKDLPVDVITVAIPGWNVRSEAAFLRSTMRVLRPDAVIWEVCPNDTWDTGGVIPPASLSWDSSPQNRRPEENAFNSMTHPLPVLPAILARERENAGLLAAVHRDFGLTVLAAPAQIPRGVWAFIAGPAGAELPAWFVPDAYSWDPRAILSPEDAHPTDWANERLALGYAARLAELGVIPGPRFTPAQQEELRVWRAWNEAPADLDRDVAELLRLLPESMSAEPEFRQLTAGYLGERRLGRHGLAHLRVPAGRRALVLDFDPLPYPEAFRRQVTVVARDFEGREREVVRDLAAGEEHVSLEIPLPAPSSRFAAREVEWRFNYDDCDYPNRCFSALLRSLSSR